MFEIKTYKKLFEPSTAELLEKVNPVIGVETLRVMIEQGQLGLYEVACDNKPIGIFVTQLDLLKDGTRELVILHAVACDKPEIHLTSVLGKVFNDLAKSLNMKSIRIHSSKRGLDKLIESEGYEFLETVFFKKVK